MELNPRDPHFAELNGPVWRGHERGRIQGEDIEEEEFWARNASVDGTAVQGASSTMPTIPGGGEYGNNNGWHTITGSLGYEDESGRGSAMDQITNAFERRKE